MRQRSGGRLAGFWELPQAGQLPVAREIGGSAGYFRHNITHHLYEVEISRAKVARAPRTYRWIGRNRLAALPISTMARKAFRAAKFAI